MPVVIPCDRGILQEYIERGDLRSNDLDLMNNTVQTTLRYIGFGAVVGGGSLFYLARRYQRRSLIPTFAGVIIGTVLGPFASATSLESHLEAEGRDTRIVLRTISTMINESHMKHVERAEARVKHRVSEAQDTSRWDQLRDTTTVESKKPNTNDEKDTINDTPDSS